MEELRLELKWTPLLKLQDFDASMSKRGTQSKRENSKRGVYMWGFATLKGFVPYYVGKANHIYERALQHVAGLTGGAYTIYHLDCLHEFHRHRDEQPDVAGTGKLYSPESVHALMNDFRSESVQQIVAQLLLWFRFTYTLVESPDVQTGWIEQLVADHFGRQYLQATVTGVAPTHLKVIHDGDDDIRRLFHRASATDEPIRMSLNGTYGDKIVAAGIGLT